MTIFNYLPFKYFHSTQAWLKSANKNTWKTCKLKIDSFKRHSIQFSFTVAFFY